MQFIRFLDCVFQEGEVKIADARVKTGRFLTYTDAEQNAARYTMNVYRVALGVLLVPWILVLYVLVVFRIVKPPMPRVDLLKAQANEMEKNKNKARKKLGFKEKPAPFNGVKPIPEQEQSGNAA
jgi:hypothetical protein